MKKNNFLTFIFAFIPGAGQMYLGMMKKGSSIMLIFAATIAFTGFLNLPILSVFLPVLWFYSFFDTFNLNGMTYEQRLTYEDKFMFDFDELLKKDWSSIVKKRHVLTGGICILLGIYMLFNNILRPLLREYFDYSWLSSLLRAVPTFVVAVAVIALGMHLVLGGKKKAMPPEDDFVEYGGKNDDRS